MQVSSLVKQKLFQKNILSPYQSINIPSHDKIYKLDEQFNKYGVDAILDVSNNLKLQKSLTYAKFKKGNTDIFYGSEVDNTFYCKSNLCEFYGWKGGDNFMMMHNISNNFIIKDFRKKD